MCLDAFFSSQPEPASSTVQSRVPEPSTSRWSLTLPGLALFLLTLLVFAPALRNGWTGWDDTAYVINNPLLKSLGGLYRIWVTGQSEQYYPVTFTSYWIQYRLWGDNPGGYHAVNVVLHACNAVLCLALMRSLGLNRLGSFVAAGLFAIHPTQVMSVAWIAEHKNTLCGLFTFTSMLCFVHFRRAESRSWAWYIASLSAFLLAMLSKTAVVGLPLSLLVLDRFVLNTPWSRSIARVAPLLLIAFAIGALTFFFEQKFISTDVPFLAERLQISGAAPWVYLSHLLWPAQLSPAYPLWSVNASVLVWWLPLIACLGVVVILALWLRRANSAAARLTTWGVAHFTLILGPSLGVIAFANLELTYVSDHFLYLASFGLFAPLGQLSDRFAMRSRARVRIASAGIMFPLLLVAGVSMRDCGVYRDAISLWTRAAAVSPDNYIVQIGLAESLDSTGKRAEAVPHYQRAAEIRPNRPDAWLFLGRAAQRANDTRTAEDAFRRALSLAPNDIPAMTGLAETLERTGRINDALATFEKAVQLDTRTEHVEPRIGLAKMYLGFARYEDALTQFSTVAELRPDLTLGHLGKSQSLRALRRDADAANAARVGLRTIRTDVALLNMLARILATSRDDAVRDPIQAERQISLALEQTDMKNPIVLETWALTLAANGKRDEAMQALAKAVHYFRQLGNERAAAKCDNLSARIAKGEDIRE